MININEKKDCCGCGACAQKCPKQCISLKEDIEGFLYPHVNISSCINCGICEKVCPTINLESTRLPLHTYAAKNKNEYIRLNSSSGGIFTIIAEDIINEGGVVFGAKFDSKWNVIHSWCETIEDLEQFRGSKYVQSSIGNTYIEAKLYLEQGRKVLFTGTPCQIAGLNKFLRKKYDNLITMDFVCHGVPSPRVWFEYLNDLLKVKSISKPIEKIEFRNKKYGWKKYSFTVSKNTYKDKEKVSRIVLQETKYNNTYLKGFVRDLYLRPSCHSCCVKNFKSGSDITIADFWHINKYMKTINDHKGCSLVFIHSNRINLNKYYHNADFYELNSNSICTSNKTISKSSIPHKNRNLFFNDFATSHYSTIALINKYATVSLKQRIRLILSNILKN